ncbi:MAG: EMC3/TMCO1 family protein [Archaeoglobaceae archaeon]
MKDALHRASIVAGIILMLGMIFSRDFRLSLGLMADPFLSPLAGIPFYIAVFVLSIITGTYSTLIQKLTVDYRRLRELQEKLSAYQKEYIDAVRKQNKAKLERLESMKHEIQEIQGELMSMQMRPMGYTLLVTLPIFSWLWERAVVSYELIFGTTRYGNITEKLPESFVEVVRSSPEIFFVKVPFSFLGGSEGVIHVAQTVVLPWWLFWYLVCSIAVGQVIRRVFRVGV